MAKKVKKNLAFERDKTLTPILYSNAIGIFTSETQGVILNFGTYVPSYHETHDDKEDSLIAQIFLSWESAEDLLKLLSEEISDHKKKRPKRKAKSKAE